VTKQAKKTVGADTYRQAIEGYKKRSMASPTTGTTGTPPHNSGVTKAQSERILIELPLSAYRVGKLIQLT